MPATRFGLAVFVGVGLLGLLTFVALEEAAAVTPGAAQSPEAPPSDPTDTIVLKGARIHTMTERGTITGTVVVADGKIHAVGPDVPTPDGAREIDLSGYTLVPGLIDSRSVLWLTGAAQRESSDRGALTILDGVDPWSEDWREVARQGVTAVYVQPSSRSSFGGVGSVLRVAPAHDLEGLVIEGSAAVQASIDGSSSRERYSRFQRLQRAIRSVKEGKEPPEPEEESDEEADEEEERERPQIPPRGRFGRGGRGGGRGSAPSQPDRTEELLEKVVAGELPLRIEVHHSDALVWALSLASDFDIPVILEGLDVTNGALVRLAELRAPVVLGPIFQPGLSSEDRSERGEDWLERITGATSRWSIGTYAGDGRSSRLLRVHAAAAVAAGLKPDDVLRAITIDAARLLGVGDVVGTIAEGQQADLAVFAGDPLDPSVPARLVMSRGEIVFEGSVRPRPAVGRAEVELPAALPSSYALRSQRVLRDGELAPATIVVRDGQIVALGEQVEVPQGLTLHDLGEAVVTPGLVAAHSHLGQAEILGDVTESDASHFRAIDVADPTSGASKAMLRGGFVQVALAPISGNTSAGVVGALRLGAGDPVASRAVAGKFALSSSSRDVERYPASLEGQRRLLGEIFGGNPPATRIYLPASVEQLLVAERKANVEAVVSGERAALIAAETGPEIATALDLIASHELRAALVGPEEILDFVPRLRSRRVGIIARPIRGSDYDTYAGQLAAAAKAGIPVAFAGESPEEIRTTAALAVEAGMTPTQALLGLTATAAELAGLPEGSARLERGGVADLVIWNASPLDLSARPVRVIVGGRVVHPEEQ